MSESTANIEAPAPAVLRARHNATAVIAQYIQDLAQRPGDGAMRPAPA